MLKQKSERGQALIVIAVALIVLIGLLGLVVDGGNAFLDKRNAQNAADSAALAASLTRIRGESDWVGAAMTAAANNGYTNDGIKSVVLVYSPPQDGPFVGNVEYIQVIITSYVNTTFAKVIGQQRITNVVEATARSKPSEIREILHGMALVSLARESNCLNQKAFLINGNANLSIIGGGVFVNSNNKECAFQQQGNGSIQVQGGSINVVGGVSIQKPQLLTPGVTVGGIPSNYPPPFFMPDVTCSEAAQISEDGSSMTPGIWDEKFPPQGVTFLEPGAYCLQDGFEATGGETLEGTDVVFKVEQGEVHFAGNASLKISAPTSGDFKGLLIFLPMENNSQVVLNGASTSSFTGTILAPASEITISGNSSPAGFHSQIIGYRIMANGSGEVVIVYDNAENYDAITMPEVQLSQ
jgi:hypothetical protein